MFEVIMDLFLILIAIIVFIAWLSAVITSDGKCHLDDIDMCDECPFPCELKNRKDKSEK